MSEGAESAGYTEGAEERGGYKSVLDVFMGTVRQVGDIAVDSWSRSLKSGIHNFPSLGKHSLAFKVEECEGKLILV